MDPRWFKMAGVAYSMAKYNMSMCAVGMAAEFRGQVRVRASTSGPISADQSCTPTTVTCACRGTLRLSVLLLSLVMQPEWQVAFNCLWPRTAIATSAIEMLAGDLGVKASRSVEIMADAAHWILTQPQEEVTGNTFIDDEVLTQKVGMSEADLNKYRMSRGLPLPLMPDFFVGDPEAMGTYIDAARKMQGVVGAFTSKFFK